MFTAAALVALDSYRVCAVVSTGFILADSAVGVFGWIYRVSAGVLDDISDTGTVFSDESENH